MNLSYDMFERVFNIKVKIHGFLKNITDNTIEYIDTTCKIQNNKYIYIIDDTTYTITNKRDEVIFNRDNPEINHTIFFHPTTITKSEYYIKELHHSLEFNIKTNRLEIINNKFIINYQILETNNEYEYIIEMSDIK